MRILVANKYLTKVGGVEAHIEAVTAWLENSGHTVVPFGMADDSLEPSEYSQYFPSAVDFRVGRPKQAYRALERATRSSETRRLLAALLDEQQIDAAYVVHIYHQLGTVVLDDLANRGIPTVLSLHDYKIGCPNYRFFSERTGQICTRCLDVKGASKWAPIYEGCWSGSRLAGVALTLEAAVTSGRRSYRRPGSIVVLNSLQEKAALSAGVEPQKIHRIAHPVTLGSQRRSAGNGRFLFVGRLVPEKGIDVLIAAAAATGLPLTIAGSGRSEDELRQQAERCDAPVEFLGSVDRETVTTLMADACALVVPSTWHEVSPLVVYEAMAADLPVIGTRVGGVTEQLDGGRGLLVDAGNAEQLGEAMLRLIRDPQLGQTLSANARAHAEQFLSPAEWSRNMENAFRSAGAHDFAAVQPPPVGLASPRS